MEHCRHESENRNQISVERCSTALKLACLKHFLENKGSDSWLAWPFVQVMALLAQAEDMTLADFSFAAKFHAADSHARFR